MPQQQQALKTAQQAPSAASLPDIAYGTYVFGRRGIVVCTDGRAYPQYVYSKEAAQEQADALNKAIGWPTPEQGREFYEANEPNIIF